MKQLISMLLALVMVFTMLPLSAFAAAPSLKITNAAGRDEGSKGTDITVHGLSDSAPLRWPPYLNSPTGPWQPLPKSKLAS